MDELRKKPEQRLETGVNEGIDVSSPLKPLILPVAGHNAEELAQRIMPTALQDILVKDMWEFLGETEENIREAFHRLPNIQWDPTVSDPYAQYTKYLNSLSAIVHEELSKHSEKPLQKIHFFDRHNNAPKDHVTGTANRPDFLAIKLLTDDSTPSEFPWSALEATGELLSGIDKEKSRAKTAAYTSYLLQARPDLVTVQGIYVDPNGFRLVVSNACGAFDTEYLKWEPRPSRLLLCAWICRLYKPAIDPSITANIKQGNPITFNITLPILPKTTYQDCKIHFAGTAFGRRTIVFACPEPEVIIKEQYIETSRRFEEGPILSRIHKKGTFPGVVRPGWYEPVQSSKEGEIVVKWGETERKKTRVILLDKAPFLKDAKTPREALVAMYDLLEITRFLHKKRKILHRDISHNNVLLRDVVPPYTSSADNDFLASVVPANTASSIKIPSPVAIPAKQSIAEDLWEMCFASYLLHTKSNLSTSPGRLDTGVLLIDFDMSEDQEPGNQRVDKKAPHARTGTPIFIARAVVSGMHKQGWFTLLPMPQLNQGNEIYEAAVPDRLESFPPNEVEHYHILKNIPHKPFQHKLKYDAESVFWLLLWWAIHAYPLEDTSPGHEEIDSRVWNALTGEQDAALDARDGTFVRSFPTGLIVHPVYQPLEDLLQDMAQQLNGDHERSSDQSRKQDDYLHEVFQRLIFKFLFTHYDEGFMTAQKGPDVRKPKNVPAMGGSLSSHRIDRTRASASSHNIRSVSSHNVRSASSRSVQSGSSLKRKRSGESTNNSDRNDGDYKPKHRK